LIQPPENLKAIAFADVRTTDSNGQKATMYAGKMVGLMFNPYSTAFAFDGKPSIYFGSITKVGQRISPPDFKDRNNPNATESFYRFGQLIEHDIERRELRKTSEPVNAGTTGAILIDLNGNMVGMTTSTATVYDREVGPGYAIPIDESVRKVIDVLRRGEEVEYGFLGVSLDDRIKTSIRILQISPFSPAENAGLMPVDTLTHINDIPANSYEDLLLYAGSSLAGTKVKLGVIERSGRRKEVLLTLGKLHHSQPFIASVRPEPVFGLRVDYLNFQQSPQGISNAGTAPVRGVRIREISVNSQAESKFKTLGENSGKWIITHVNGTAISSPSEFYKASKDQSSVKLTLRDWEAPNRHELTLP
jgi:serine protease Do